MKYLGVKEQLQIEREKNEALKAKMLALQANTDYIAMMCDVVLEEPNSEGGTENE